jgi:UDP-glucose 4-epimerase
MTQASQRILVTGGAGFIGRNLVARLTATGAMVRVLDSDLNDAPAQLDGRAVDRVAGSVTDSACVADALGDITTVVHLAAESGIASSISDPVGTATTNVLGTIIALDESRKAGVQRFILASSGAVLGNQPLLPLRETGLPAPVSPYGASKLASESYCNAFRSTYGISTLALRFANVYGPYCAHKTNAIPLFLKAALSGAPIMVYGDGEQTRDFVYVDDICQGIIAACERQEVTGVLHLGSGRETSVNKLVSIMSRSLGRKLNIEYLPSRPGETKRSSLSITAAREQLNYDPQIDIEEGVQRLHRWLVENP